MSLSNLTALEINERTAKIKHPGMSYINITGDVITVYNGRNPIDSYDWVNDDALAFRLMVDNCIDLNFDENNPESVEAIVASNGSAGFIIHSVEEYFNPVNKAEKSRRVVCECFLLMNGVES